MLRIQMKQNTKILFEKRKKPVSIILPIQELVQNIKVI